MPCNNNWNMRVPTKGCPFIERLSLLVEHEQLSREQRKQTRLVKQARLKPPATAQELDYQSARNLERSQQQTWPKESGCAGARTCSLPAPVAVENLPGFVRAGTKPVSKGIALVTTGRHVCRF